MFEQTFKSLDDVLWKEAGCSSELDYIEQKKSMEAEMVSKRYDFIIQPEFRGSTWVAPKNPDGSFDRDEPLKGDDLVDFAA